MADFLWLYSVAIALPVTVAGVHALRLRRGFHDGGRLPSVRHVAALAGGASRVTETVVAPMLEREQARLGGSGSEGRRRLTWRISTGTWILPALLVVALALLAWSDGTASESYGSAGSF